jgi:amino acid transporter
VTDLSTVRRRLFGPALDPFDPRTRQHVAFAAFFAWVWLGADGISSIAYGPEEAFLALGEHPGLGLYLAIATAVTVFVIALAYNQVIELFPTGGGGYRVATRLLGPYAGLTAGAALALDYVLTIAISVASGFDALLSLLPAHFASWKVPGGLLIIALLALLNLRGLKQSMRLVLPVFLGFIVIHVLLIAAGIASHAGRFPQLVPATLSETASLASQLGWTGVAALLLVAYAHGGGTYTGLEAVSNNVNVLAEPRVHTGKVTMLYMAASLAFAAGGIIVLYVLWDARPEPGKTLNAVVFGSIIHSFEWRTAWLEQAAVVAVLALEAGLLFIAANVGFLGGPAVLSNMAADSWVPHKFRYLSTRLVTQNGILVMGLGAAAMLLITSANVRLLVVVYSLSVFLTIALSLLGLYVYWWRHRSERIWMMRLGLSATGFLLCAVIFSMLVTQKFMEGGWLAALILVAIIALCMLVRHHYDWTKRHIRGIDEAFSGLAFGSVTVPPAVDPEKTTAAFLVGTSRGGGLHALLWVQRMFPGHFHNFIFVNARSVDPQSYGGREDLEAMKTEANAALSYFVNFCHSQGWAAKSYLSFGTDPIDEVTRLAERAYAEFPGAIFFTSQLIFRHDNWFTRLLHNQAPLVLQRRFHLRGMQMIILPMHLVV